MAQAQKLEQVSDEEILDSLERLEDLRANRAQERYLLHDAQRKVDAVLMRFNIRSAIRGYVPQ